MSSKPRLEFFFDLSSPWTYLAFANLSGVEQRSGASAILRPVLVGGIFNAVNQSVYESRAQSDNPKLIHVFRTMGDWAKIAGIEINFPPPGHPAKSVTAMRMACALQDDQDQLRAFTAAAFARYFGQSQNLDEPETLIAAANDAGQDGEALIARTQEQSVKDILRANTEEAIARGAYGSPSIFVDEKFMYFGNDQLPLVEARLKGEF